MLFYVIRQNGGRSKGDSKRDVHAQKKHSAKNWEDTVIQLPENNLFCPLGYPFLPLITGNFIIMSIKSLLMDTFLMN